jgi:hypothetical protein
MVLEWSAREVPKALSGATFRTHAGMAYTWSALDTPQALRVA